MTKKKILLAVVVIMLGSSFPSTAMLYKVSLRSRVCVSQQKRKNQAVKKEKMQKMQCTNSSFKEKIDRFKQVVKHKKVFENNQFEGMKERQEFHRLLHNHDSLQTPWRNSYSKSVDQKQPQENKQLCPFCDQFSKKEDEKNYILKRLSHCVIMLNLYPYTLGHLLVVPYSHSSSLDYLTKETRQELIEAQALSLPILRKTFNYEGFNVGMNMGHKIAGASIPEHLHIHIVPRRMGDIGFLGTIASTQLVSANMPDIFNLLKDEFQK